MAKIIIHIDLNSFFASCELAKNKSYRNKPLVVAGNSRRGIILTASYEARKFGIRAAMPLFQAERLCKDLIIVPPNMELYKHYSKLFFLELEKYCDAYIAASIDEAYLDVTESSKKYSNALELAQILQKSLLDKYNLPTSIGIAPNKFLAKMASNMKKPMGITILRKRDIPQMLWPLPIEELHGVGNKTIPRLKNIGIYYIEDLTKEVYQTKLKEIFGKQYEPIMQQIYGRSSDEVHQKDYDDQDQIGNSKTLEKDTDQIELIKNQLSLLVKQVSMRMKNKNVMSRHFSINYKYNRLESVSRSITIDNYANDFETLDEVAWNLFELHWTGEPIRLIGFSSSQLIPTSFSHQQLSIFNYEKHELNKKEKVVEHIRKKFGDNSIYKASEKRFKR